MRSPRAVLSLAPNALSWRKKLMIVLIPDKPDHHMLATIVPGKILVEFRSPIEIFVYDVVHRYDRLSFFRVATHLGNC
jgi:hypothetical protein